MIPRDKIVNIPDESLEILERRTIYEKQFKMPAGITKLIRSREPLHYKENPTDPNSPLKNVDLTFRLVDDKYVIDKAPFTLEVFSDSVGFTYTSKTGGDCTVTLKSIDDVPVGDLTLSITPRMDGSKLWWDDVVGDLDIYVEVNGRGCEIFKTIKHEDAPHTFEWDYDESEESNFVHVNKNKAWDGDTDEAQTELVSTDEVISSGRKTYTSRQKVNKKTFKINRRTRVKEIQDKITYPIKFDVPDITEQIVSGGDDVFTNRANGNFNSWDSNNTKLSVGFSSYTSYYTGYGTQTYPPYSYYTYTTTTTFSNTKNAGIRFQSLGIPNGSTIDLANLVVSNKSGNTGPIRIYGDDVDDAAPWANNVL